MSLRPAWIVIALLALGVVPGAMAEVITKPFRIYAITFRGMTEVEKGFQDYFAARNIPIEITYRDLAQINAMNSYRPTKSIGVIYTPTDSYLNTQAKTLIVPAAMESRLATFASTEGLMANGALLGLIAGYHAIGQFTAYKAEQILVGRVAPSRIPVETLTRFSLVVRMEAARTLAMPPPLPMFNYAEMIPVPLELASK